ncbi:hypothetical protein [Arthrobacter sp. OV608]|uniref:hypothetical protein n=1 Tax=Arthrobacter sp. OV608 TaxID=1882768 RepID=UPI0008CACD91|nr:hypothetical protein [Arthrobacter sp. OV608]SER31190.1 hypothetical protein SAMN05444745_13317 [Arthrobacter sp. OV608]
MSVMRKVAAGAAGSLMLIGAVAVPSDAARNTTFQDGLVNVNVGDVTVIEDVNVALVDVVDVVVTACGVNVGPAAVAILGEAIAVDNSGRSMTVCETATGAPVTIMQNTGA